VIVCEPTVIVVAGLELSRPCVSNWNTPAGLAVVPLGALFWMALPSAPMTGVAHVPSFGLQPLPAAASRRTTSTRSSVATHSR
jgi:hypothetical protein